MVYFLLGCQFVLNMGPIFTNFREALYNRRNKVKGEMKLSIAGSSLYDGPPAVFSQSEWIVADAGSRGCSRRLNPLVLIQFRVDFERR